MTENTWNKVKERKKLKNLFLTTQNHRQKADIKEQYNQINKKVKRSARKDKNLYTDVKASEAEIASKRGDLKTLYKITKQLQEK